MPVFRRRDPQVHSGAASDVAGASVHQPPVGRVQELRKVRRRPTATHRNQATNRHQVISLRYNLTVPTPLGRSFSCQPRFYIHESISRKKYQGTALQCLYIAVCRLNCYSPFWFRKHLSFAFREMLSNYVLLFCPILIMLYNENLY